MSLWVATYFLLSYWSHVTCILEVMQRVIYKGWPSPDLDQSIKQVQFNNKLSFFIIKDANFAKTKWKYFWHFPVAHLFPLKPFYFWKFCLTFEIDILILWDIPMWRAATD